MDADSVPVVAALADLDEDEVAALMTPQTTRPAEAGPVLARYELLLAAREAETGETKAEQRESGGFGNRKLVLRASRESRSGARARG